MLRGRVGSNSGSVGVESFGVLKGVVREGGVRCGCAA
jgi:hypothetical protein